MMSHIHPGGHSFTADVQDLIVKFFKEYPRKVKGE